MAQLYPDIQDLSLEFRLQSVYLVKEVLYSELQILSGLTGRDGKLAEQKDCITHEVLRGCLFKGEYR